MADNNNPIKNPYQSGTSLDISAIVSTLAELNTNSRNTLDVLNQLKNYTANNNSSQSSSNNKDNITYKDLEKLFKEYVQTGFKDTTSAQEKSLHRPRVDYRDSEAFNTGAAKNAEALKELTSTYTRTQKDAKDLHSDLTKSIRELDKVGLSKSLQGIKNHTGSIGNELQGLLMSIKDTEKGINGTYKELIKERDIIKQHSLQKQLDIEKQYFEDINKVKQKEIESSYRLMRLSTEMASKTEQFMPESVKKWNQISTQFKTFLNPKSSEEYISYMDDVAAAQSGLNIQKTDNTLELARIQAIVDDAREALTKAQEQLETADEYKKAQLKESIEEETRRINIYELEIDRIERENKLIDNQVESLDEQRKYVESNATFTKNAVGKLGDALTKVIGTVVDRKLQNLESAANKMFSAIEETQKTLGRTLKMDMGQYDVFVDKMQSLASDLGVAVTSDQLLQAAATASQAGITNEDLLGQFAVAQAKLDETGTFFQMDEEFMKNLQAEYLRNIQSGMSVSDATQAFQKNIDTIIATQKGLADNFGSATAMANGGSQELFNTLNEFVKSGQMEQKDFQKNFYEVMSMMQTIDVNRGDSSTLMEVVASLRDNPVGELSTDLKAFLAQTGLSQNEILEAINSGDMADIMMKYIEHIGATYTASNQTDLRYQSRAYSPSLTASQLNNLKTFGEDMISTYSENALTETDIAGIGEDISESLEKGTYLTKTEEWEKRNLTLMEDVAESAQKIADGQFWMDQGFNKTRSLINDGLSMLLTFLAGRLMGGGLGGSGTGVGNVPSFGGMRDFLTGNKSTTAGKIGTYGTMAVGGTMSISTLVKHSIDDGLSDGLMESFRDPTFTSGLGTVIGGAVGGPIGGAIGGALGTMVPAVSEGLENWLTRNISDAAKEYEEIQMNNAKQLEEAAKSLSEAADKHNSNIQNIKDSTNQQLAFFEQYSEAQKEHFIDQMDLTDAEKANLAEEKGITANQLTSNDLFTAAVQKWMGQQEAQIEEERALERGTSLVQGSLANAVGVNNAIDYSASDISKMSAEAKQSKIATYNAMGAGLEWEDVKNLSDEDLAQLFTELEEQGVNTRVMLGNESGTQLLTDIENYAANNGMNFEEAASQYLQKVDPNLYTGEDLDTAVEVLSNAETWKSKYDSENDEFHKRLEEVLKENPDVIDYKELFDAYKKKYSNFEYSAVEGLTFDAGNNPLINGNLLIAKDGDSVILPDLRHTGTGEDIGGTYGNAVNMARTNYNPEFYSGKYRTGLDFVPMDDYIALLHQGEMVLNKHEAEDYRKSKFNTMASLLNVEDTIHQAVQTTVHNLTGRDNTVLDISPITGSVNTQTDKLVDILTKILQVLSSGSGGSGRSYLPKSLVHMNSDISLL